MLEIVQLQLDNIIARVHYGAKNIFETSFIIASKTFVERNTEILTIRQETGMLTPAPTPRTQASRPGGW